MPKGERPPMNMAVQLLWLAAFVVAAVVAAVRRDWTGLSLALLWACSDATALRVMALERAQEMHMNGRKAGRRGDR